MTRPDGPRGPRRPPPNGQPPPQVPPGQPPPQVPPGQPPPQVPPGQPPGQVPPGGPPPRQGPPPAGNRPGPPPARPGGPPPAPGRGPGGPAAAPDGAAPQRPGGFALPGRGRRSAAGAAGAGAAGAGAARPAAGRAAAPPAAAPPAAAPRADPTRVGAPAGDWARDPQVSYDPSYAEAPAARPSWRERLPQRRPGSAGGGRDGSRRDDAGRPRPGGRRRLSWPKRIGAVLAVLLLFVVGFAIYLDTQMTRKEALTSYSGRPTGGSGTNWLIVGSDSRAGLSTTREEELSTGDADGNRTDTMMLVHVGSFGGQTSLISLPRDSLVEIDGRRSRLNSAYTIGGPELLTRTIQDETGLRIDHYAEIGFEGFSTMVDAVGGVEMCLDEPIDDPKAGIDLPGGCQELDGPKALGFVRTRAFPNADLQRVQNQRAFLAALIGKAASPTTLLNPFASIPFANAAIGTLTVDESTHIWNMASLGLAMKSLSGGSGVTTTVPVDLSSAVSGAVVWDRKNAPRLWTALNEGEDIPTDLVPK